MSTAAFYSHKSSSYSMLSAAVAMVCIAIAPVAASAAASGTARALGGQTETMLTAHMHGREMLQACGSDTAQTGRYVGAGCRWTRIPGLEETIQACEAECEASGYELCSYRTNGVCQGTTPDGGRCVFRNTRPWMANWQTFTICSDSTPPPTPPTGGVTPLPTGAAWDYQIGGAYTPPGGTVVVSRDWFDSDPLGGSGTYSICYVNAFQTQADGNGVRPDLTDNWPAEVVITELEDPEWGGEFLIDISTPELRTIAANHVQQMIATCASKGYDAVEFDNLDSFTRYSDTGFGQSDAVAYATMLVSATHALGLAAAQKNTYELLASRAVIGFDFAVVEQCGEFDECTSFRDAYNGAMVGVEYGASGFAAACGAISDTSAIVRRDVQVTAPGSSTYVIDQCGP